MGAENQYFGKTVPCPACQSNTEIQIARKDSYRLINRAADARPLQYEWLVEGDPLLKPHHLVVFQCPVCLYTDLSDQFVRPQELTRPRIRTFTSLPERSIELLSICHRTWKTAPRPEAGAAALHLAALFIAIQPEWDEVDQRHIGRLALRLGWLYNECGLTGPMEEFNPEAAGAAGQVLKQSTEILRKSAVELHLATGAAPESGSSQVDRYQQIVRALGQKVSELRELSLTLDDALERESAASIQRRPAEPPTLIEHLLPLLAAVRHVWTEAPLDEIQAHKLAAQSLELCLTADKAFASKEQIVRTVKLTAELFRKVGHHDNALNLIASALDGNCSPDSANEKNTMHDRIALAGLLAAQKRTILAELLRRSRLQIHRILSRPMHSVAEAIIALQEARISPHIIAELRRSGELEQSLSSRQSA